MIGDDAEFPLAVKLCKLLGMSIWLYIDKVRGRRTVNIKTINPCLLIFISSLFKFLKQ